MRKFPGFLLWSLIGLSSCSPLRLQHPMKVSDHDWIMYGGNSKRTNVAPCALSFPLVRVWTYDASAGFSPYPLAVVDSLLFIANLQGEIRIVGISDGREISSHDFGSAIYGTPVIDCDTMYVAMTRNETNLFAYTLTTGTMQWKRNLGDVETSPLLVRSRLIVSTYDGKVICLDKTSGEIVWTYRIPGKVRAGMIRSSPASDGSTVVFGCDNGRMYAVSADSGKFRWSVATRRSIVSSPSIADGMVFAGSLDSTFYAFGLDSGTVLWRRSLGSRIFGSQAVSLGRICVGTSAGELFCLDANNGKTLWSEHTEGILNTAPLISDSVVFVGCFDKNLYAFSMISGNRLGKFPLSGRIKAGPVACDGYLFVADDDRTVSAFQHRNE